MRKTTVEKLRADSKLLLSSIEQLELKIQALDDEANTDNIILARLMTKDSYKLALQYFLKTKIVTADVLAEIGINRKSRQYDKAYFPLYQALHKFYVVHLIAQAQRLFNVEQVAQS